MELGIPEVRERTKTVAQNAYARLRSVNEGEVIGELTKLKLDNYAESYLTTTREMALQKTPIIRGHHIFAQANSLAVAVIDAEKVVTGSAEIKFTRPVMVGDVIKARAEVKEIKGKKYFVEIKIYKDSDLVFYGDFTMFKLENGGV